MSVTVLARILAGVVWGMLFIVLAVLAPRAAANRTSVGKKKRVMAKIHAPDFGRREDFTEEGWQYRNAMLGAIAVASIVAVSLLVVAYLTE